MSLLSSDDKYAYLQAINNLWALKILHNSGVDVSGINFGEHILEVLLKRIFETVEFKERTPDPEEEWPGDYDPFMITVTDSRIHEISKRGTWSDFGELTDILNRLPLLDDDDFFIREWAPIDDWDWLENEDGEICGIVFKYYDTTPYYRQEAVVLTGFIKKLNEVCENGRDYRDHGRPRGDCEGNRPEQKRKADR